jgi:hypothetical protein
LRVKIINKIKELISCYKKYNQDKEEVLKNLENGFEKIKITTSSINEKVREIDNMNKVLQLQNEITKYQIEVQFQNEKEIKNELLINILEPGRTHVYSNYINVYFDEKSSSEKLLVYLLSDSIIFVKPQDDELGYQYIDICNLKSSPSPWCQEYLFDKRYFQLNTFQKSIVFKALGIFLFNGRNWKTTF